MPAGVQFICPAFEEAKLFAIASAYEALSGFASKRPPVWNA
jgi:Asp-tRNA(Asn)/Glu-tRNA(Gln) amidotransferase A subunit family amidase